MSFYHHILRILNMRKISLQRRKDITQRLKDGLSHRQIAQQYGVSVGTVSNIRKSLSAALPEPKIGRPKKLLFHHHRFLEREFKRRTVKTVWQACQAIKERFRTAVSRTTMRKELIKLQFKARVIKKKPLLTKQHRKNRLLFAHIFKDWTVDDWKGVIWSDETKINRLGSDGRRYCWLKASGLTSNIIQPTLKFGGGSIMVWGCMTWAGVGNMTVIEGIMTSDVYIKILEDNLVPTMEALCVFSDIDNMIFQQDGDPKHTASTTKAWLRRKGIETMDWPAQSPDLNPIEHLWGMLKRRLGQSTLSPKGQQELAERVAQEWDKITVAECQRLIESMPQRLQAVIRAKGGHTKH
ncbi:related to transposase [Ustilago trichophora]|uniref:Related to transposase n=1 Tax=Ustilago trichophora TaxID=86804 RepID=A0A5C3EEB2_9BASI|nr:related to transposase [Ustilago trichophora]